MNEERILDKLDGLDAKTTAVLVEIARIQEQVKDVPDLRTRVASLERRMWAAIGALAMAGGSIASQIYGAVKGA